MIKIHFLSSFGNCCRIKFLNYQSIVGYLNCNFPVLLTSLLGCSFALERKCKIFLQSMKTSCVCSLCVTRPPRTLPSGRGGGRVQDENVWENVFVGRNCRFGMNIFSSRMSGHVSVLFNSSQRRQQLISLIITPAAREEEITVKSADRKRFNSQLVP